MYILYVFFQSQTFYIFMSRMKQYFFFLLRNSSELQQESGDNQCPAPQESSLACRACYRSALFSTTFFCPAVVPHFSFWGVNNLPQQPLPSSNSGFGPWMSLFFTSCSFPLILSTSVSTWSLLALCRVIQLPTTSSQINFLTYFCALRQ